MSFSTYVGAEVTWSVSSIHPSICAGCHHRCWMPMVHNKAVWTIAFLSGLDPGRTSNSLKEPCLFCSLYWVQSLKTSYQRTAPQPLVIWWWLLFALHNLCILDKYNTQNEGEQKGNKSDYIIQSYHNVAYISTCNLFVNTEGGCVLQNFSGMCSTQAVSRLKYTDLWHQHT